MLKNETTQDLRKQVLGLMAQAVDTYRTEHNIKGMVRRSESERVLRTYAEFHSRLLGGHAHVDDHHADVVEKMFELTKGVPLAEVLAMTLDLMHVVATIHIVYDAKGLFHVEE